MRVVRLDVRRCATQPAEEDVAEDCIAYSVVIRGATAVAIRDLAAGRHRSTPHIRGQKGHEAELVLKALQTGLPGALQASGERPSRTESTRAEFQQALTALHRMERRWAAMSVAWGCLALVVLLAAWTS